MPFVVGAALLATVAAVIGIFLATRGGGNPDQQVRTASAEPAPVPKPPPTVASTQPDVPPPREPTADAVPPTITIAEPAPSARPVPPPPAKRPPARAPESTGSGTPKVAVAPPAPPVVRAPFIVRDTLNSITLPPPASGDGVLSVQAEPFGDVFLDGKAYGEAPKEFRVHAGAHTVRVTHPALGVREKRVVVVAGKRVPWTANFEQ
jgi:hypothetical protein